MAKVNESKYYDRKGNDISEFLVTDPAKKDHTIFGTTSNGATIAICEVSHHTFGEEYTD
jgi:hypothetical protein